MLIKLLSFMMILIGALFILLATIRYFQLTKTSLSEQKSEKKKKTGIEIIRNMMSIFHVIFLLGYIYFAIFVLLKDVDTVFIFVALLLLFGGFYVFLDVENQVRMFKELFERNKELIVTQSEVEKRNENLYLEIQSGWEELWHRDQLLGTVNSVASMLLSPKIDDFDGLLNKSVEMLSNCIRVNRGCVWKKYEDSGEMFLTMIANWTSGDTPDDPSFYEDFEYSKSLFAVDSLKDEKGCITGVVGDVPEEHLWIMNQKNIKSFLIVPIQVEEKFWGVIAFDDCSEERVFTNDENDLICSVSLLIGNAFERNQLMQNLVIAREEALSSTKAKGDFLANMSHEIRTPINAVTGMATIAQESDDIDKIKDCLTKIDAASKQLLGLINDILDMSKIEAQKFDLSEIPFSVTETIHNVKSIIGIKAVEKNQELVLNIENGLPPVVIGDDMRLSQIILNLLSNAVKFTPENGKIEFSVKVFYEEDMNDKYEIIIKDNGIGISEKQLPKLFDAFKQADGTTTRRFGGTGLGLVISKNLAKLMGGDITVNSELDKGSEFIVTVYLKRAKANTEIQRTLIKDVHYDFSKYSVLLVEDIDINREIIYELLQDSGVHLEYVEDGQKAIEEFEKNHEKYDMILMDIQMPVLDGYSATEMIRKMEYDNAKTIPIIAMTANAFKEDIARAKKAGMNAHVSKPIDIDVLIETMAKFLINDERD